MSGKRLIGFMALLMASNGLSCATEQTAVQLQPIPSPAQSIPGQDQLAFLPVQAKPTQAQEPAIPRRPPVIRQGPRSAVTQGRQQAQANPLPTPPANSAPVTPSEPGDPKSPATPAPLQNRPLPSPVPSGGGLVSLNFNRADLVEIIHILAQHLKLTYTIDPDVKGTVTIHSAEPLKAEDVLPIFHQVLRMNGAVAVKAGNIYRITTIKDGKVMARPVGQNREDSFAMQIVPVRFFSVGEMKKLLMPFVMPGGELIDYPRGNFLIIIDLPSNIRRLIEIAELIDVQVFAGTRMEIYQPKVASAEELAQEMTKIMQSYASSAPQADSFTAQFIPLPRINQLLVISHSEAAWTYAKRWLDRVDVVTEGPGRRIFIYPVENGKATELADVLGQALGQPTTGRREPARTLQDLHRTTPSGTGQLGGSRSTTSQNQPLGAYAAVPAPGRSPTPTTAPSTGVAPPPGILAPPGATSPGAKQEEQIRIVADPATNSIIIYGTVQEFQNIKNILKELDAVPRQVLLEAMILQVELGDTEDFGVDYQIEAKPTTIFGKTFDSRGALRTLGESLFPNAPDFSGLGGGGASAIVGNRIVKALIRAAATDSRIKLISSPSVLASDNRPARIQVGTEEPIPTGTINAATGGDNISSSTTIQYRNTGRIMTIIPQVNSQGLVNLQIKAEVSARGDDVPVGDTTYPSFDTQDAETTAVVHDGETLVIGGLIGERKSKARRGIPYLMDLPVIGRFFGTTSDESTRTELIMLITPHVIRNREESRSVSEEFKNRLSTARDELERIRSDQEREAQKRERLRREHQRLLKEQEKEKQRKQEEEKPIAPAPSSGAAGVAPSPSNVPDAPLPAILQETSIMPGQAPSVSPEVKIVTGVPRTAEENSLTRNEVAQAGEGIEQPGTATRPQAPSSAIHPPAREEPSIPVIAHAAPMRPDEEKAAQTWTVQVASFRRETDAESLAQKLRKRGYSASVTTAHIDNKTWYRVRIGQFANRGEAGEVQRKLATREQFPQTLIFSQ